MSTIFVPRETRSGESRAAATPETVKRLGKAGFTVTVEAEVGLRAGFPDREYAAAGAQVVADRRAALAAADAVLCVREPDPEEAGALKAGAVLLGLLAPHRNLEMVERLASTRVTSLAMELLPRVTRAQSMDALSSQASIAGYKAVLLAAWRLGRYFPLMMTAAGTVPPARVVVMGAGVAGLQAVATGRRLGAVVEVSDIRPAVKEEVESLGGRFIDLAVEESGEGEGGYAREMGEDFLRRQREIVREHLATADAVITTALVPGKPAPTLLTAEMLEALRPGGVVVDLAIEQGGNCELSRADEEVVHRGVTILAPSNLAATMAHDASTLYSRNLLALLLHMTSDGRVAVDPQDEIVGPSLLTHGGEIVHQPTAQLLATTA